MSTKSFLRSVWAAVVPTERIAGNPPASSRLSSGRPALQAAKLLAFSLLISINCALSVSAQTTGTLAGSSTAITAGQSVNLTSLGSSDWAHWGHSSNAHRMDHKALSAATPVGLISNYTVLGTGTAGSYPYNLVNYTWANGSTTTSAKSEVYVGNNGSGFSLSVPADTTSRTFTLYVGGYNDTATLTAHLSDGSAADFVDSSYGYNKPGNTNGHNYQAVYTLTYQAATAGQTLTVSWKQTSALTRGGNVTLQAAALATAAPAAGPAAPTNLTATPQWAKSCPVCGGMAMAHIVLAWDADASATSYTVYRGGVKVQDGLTSPAWTDMDVVSKTSYTYTVTATNAGGAKSGLSASATATAPSDPNAASTIALTAPTNLAVQGLLIGEDGTDVLSWTPAFGAVSYNIYQYGNLIGSSQSPTYTVPVTTHVSDWTYAVTAVDATGMESLPSALAGALQTFAMSNKPSWISQTTPAVPTNVTATPEWNNGGPRLRVVWQGNGNAQTYNVYRDGTLVARGLWDLYYLDSAAQPGETHTYAVSAVNDYWPGTVESARTTPLAAQALTAAPTPLGVKVQVTKVVANDDSAVIFFKEVPGAVDYRIYDVLHPSKVKYAGVRNFGSQIPLSIEWNGVDPVNGSDLVVEAVDKLGPFQIMDGMAGPGAMAMDGMMHQAINGQGDPSNIPIVLAASDPFHVTAAPMTLTGSQVFFDNFRGEKPLVTLPMPARIAGSDIGTPNDYLEQGNDKWIVKQYGTDITDSKVFFMGNHLMDTEFDGGGPGSSGPPHNSNSSLVFQPKATADISGGKVLHVTFEVDAHFDGRRWCDLFVAPAGDTLLNPGKFAQGDGGNNIATASTQLFRWVVSGAHSMALYNKGTETSLVQSTDWNDGYSLYRIGWNASGPLANGTTQDLDKRHRFDLYLSQTHYRIVETTPDGMYNVLRDKDFPAGTSLPFTQCQVYFVHQVYHTANDRPELVTYYPYDSYWYNYRPFSDERHWDNMGQEVLSAFPK